MMPFVSFIFCYFLINASVSVCGWVCTIFIVSSLNKVMASDSLSNWLPKQTSDVCECLRGSRVRGFRVAHQFESVCEWRRNFLIVFLFVRFCVYVWWLFFCFWSEPLFSLRFCFCVYLPWRVICIAINGFHIHSNLVSFEIKKINKK